MKKTRLTRELIEKAISVFKVRKQIRAGEGLSRAELRTLKRNGIVGLQTYRNKVNSFNIWYLEKSGIDAMIGKVGS